MGLRLRGSVLHGITNEILLDKLTDEELWEWYRVQRLDLTKEKKMEKEKKKKAEEEAIIILVKKGMKKTKNKKKAAPAEEAPPKAIKKDMKAKK
jgi:hypothetical protein